MLAELRLENYTVIDNVAVEFSPGLNLLTGETGSGKSILIDALSLLLGEKASSDVDLMVVGEVSFADVVSALAQIETKLGREVNPTVYGPREFREKLVSKNHFLSTVAKEKKLFVIGDEREFRRLGQERLARRAQ